jgi:hypothetical protein
MATAPMTVNLETPGEDLARNTVSVKLRLGAVGNSRKVSSAQRFVWPPSPVSPLSLTSTPGSEFFTFLADKAFVFSEGSPEF